MNMNKRNSILREIFLVAFKVSLITLIASAIGFAVVYFTKNDVGYAFLTAICTGVISLVLLSLTLPVKTSDRISKRINSFSFDIPYGDDFYFELEEFKAKAIEQNKLNADRLEEMSQLHKKQDSMRRDFTANVSHELKTPLTSIRGYAELIRDGMVKSEDTSRFAGKIYDEAQRLITLVGDIIKLSQLDGNDVNVTLEDIDLYEMCEAVISQLERAAEERNVTVSLSGDRSVITGPFQIVEEIIFNLVDNAIKYNHVGGQVLVKIRQRIDGIELEVIDTGIGIAEEDIPHVFERFWRADKSHSKEIGGTGLGLSIVKHGAMFMDANISIKSELGNGTTIRIVF